MVWAERPANWDKPGHEDRGDEREAILDRIEATPEVQLPYKLVDESVSSATTGATYQNDDHLSASVVANGVYVVELNINTTIGAGNLNTQFTFPSGTAENASFDWSNNSVAYSAAWQKIASSSSPLVAGGFSTGGPIRIMFTLFVGSTGGTLQLQWAQASANAANTTLLKGSWLRVTRVA
jgi:hypothetical protein